MTSQFKRDDRVEAVPDVHTRRFDDELVLLDLAGGEYYALNPVGADIWEQLVSGGSAEEVGRVVSERYEVSYEQAVEDCLALIAELARRRLVRKV